MQDEFLFAGFGGQGVMFVGQLLAYAAMEAGREVTWIPSYGPEMRGGTAHCYVVMGDRPIGSPVVQYPQVVVVFNNPSFELYELVVAQNGLLARNASLVDRKTARTDITELAVPASDLAEEVGSLKVVNVVMLGAVLAVRPALSLETIRRALDCHIPPHRRDMLELNMKALDKGAEFVSALLGLGN